MPAIGPRLITVQTSSGSACRFGDELPNPLKNNWAINLNSTFGEWFKDVRTDSGLCGHLRSARVIMADVQPEQTVQNPVAVAVACLSTFLNS